MRQVLHLGSCLKCQGNYDESVIAFFNLKCKCGGKTELVALSQRLYTMRTKDKLVRETQ